MVSELFDSWPCYCIGLVLHDILVLHESNLFLYMYSTAEGFHFSAHYFYQ